MGSCMSACCCLLACLLLQLRLSAHLLCPQAQAARWVTVWSAVATTPSAKGHVGSFAQPNGKQCNLITDIVLCMTLHPCQANRHSLLQARMSHLVHTITCLQGTVRHMDLRQEASAAHRSGQLQLFECQPGTKPDQVPGPQPGALVRTLLP